MIPLPPKESPQAQQPPPLKIKGAGIKGLALSYFLRQKGISSVIYEKSDRAGGWIKTLDDGGFLFEAGPRGFRPSPVVMDLIKSCNLESQILYPDPSAKKRYIYKNNTIKPLWHFAPLLIGGLLRDMILPKETKELSIKDYFSRRMGRAFTAQLIDPLISGIFAGDIDRLSAQKCLPGMTKEGSVLKSILSQPKYPLISFKGGMRTLIDRLKVGQEIVYNDEDALCDIDCTQDPTQEAVSVVSVNLGWKKQKLDYSGFGYLIPQMEKESILGVVFDSKVFPSQNRHPEELRLTAMLGGAHHLHLVDLNDDEIQSLTLEAISKHLKINTLPDEIRINRAYHSIPQPYIGSPLTGVGVAHAIESAFLQANS